MEIIPEFTQGVFDFGAPDPEQQNVKMKHCPRCEQWLATKRFGRMGDGLQFYCKDCQSKMRKTTYARRRDQGLCNKCLAPTTDKSSLCEQCSTKQNQLRQETGSNRVAAKRYLDKLRDEVLAAYGGKCTACGERQPEFLSIDHINDDGANHRRSTGNGSYFYQWLSKNGFPQDGFQLLCANCNWLKYVSRQQAEKTYNQLWYAKLRQEVIDAYGGICSCCAESKNEVLTIDHVNNDGAKHRREIGRGGANLYAWLRKQGFPRDRFALLCFNCNRARFYYGTCPHQNINS